MSDVHARIQDVRCSCSAHTVVYSARTVVYSARTVVYSWYKPVSLRDVGLTILPFDYKYLKYGIIEVDQTLYPIPHGHESSRPNRREQ